jgi:hypothetical protein
MTDARDERLRTLRREIAARLRHVCTDWPRDLFDSMVDRLATVTLKYEHGPGLLPYDRRSTDRLLADLKAALARSKNNHAREPDGTDG